MSSRIRHPEFLAALHAAPPVAECPWMRVELRGETQTIVFALAVWDGWIVATAPIAKAWIGQRARDAWRYWRQRRAKLMRIG